MIDTVFTNKLIEVTYCSDLVNEHVVGSSLDKASAVHILISLPRNPKYSEHAKCSAREVLWYCAPIVCALCQKLAVSHT